MNIDWYHFEKEGYYISVRNVNERIERLNPLYIRINTLNKNVDKLLTVLLDRYLVYLDAISLKECVFSILRESVMNAVKANSKRVFFLENGLNILNPADYAKGMTTFKQEMIRDKDRYAQLLEKKNFHCLITLAFNRNSFLMKVSNNAPILPEEFRRVENRIGKSKKYNDLGEVFADHADDSEGAGLGLAMSLLMLKNEGIEGNCYQIKGEGGITSAYIKIPLDFKHRNVSFQRTVEIIAEIDKLPTFPENLNQLMSVINKPDSSMSHITDLVGRDVSLSTNILKLANSASFSMGRKVETLEDAIKRIGLSELNNILLSLGTKKILEDRYKEFENIWERSSLSAFICRRLGERMGWKKTFITNLVCAALLHDIGLVLLLTLEPDTVHRLTDITGKNLLPSPLGLEEAALGITHTSLGSMICEKWNFSDTIRVAAEYHHRPLMAKRESKDIVYSVYLSDWMIDCHDGKADSAAIHWEVLQYFGFKKDDDWREFGEAVIKEYGTFTNQV
ncbi:HD family phosphohydrolase [Leptospira perolatii]|uniref:HD family phosphohydrolase n=1 Tax=Leptospira perolatii TaxID=2023191 RepID=A0A2M9ZSD9_9LEPT|nr:HDOD domain-containing protein [Leptospira perolatii]PJZ71355.1 HD family phosphohydrolase [Leptospira perolatii]PJZ74889.1 HD family phosphohydrolase [Leptospira perolatii]